MTHAKKHEKPSKGLAKLRPVTAVFKKIPQLVEQRLLPRMIDCTCGIASIAKQRELIVPKATGVVLEVGVGTGLNAPFYNRTQVKQVIGVDPSLHPIAKRRFKQAGIDLIEKPISANQLPLADNSVDSIVMTYTLCSIDDPSQALQEMKRVLKPSGKLLFSEHGLSCQHKDSTAWWQNKLNPFWQPFSGGCQLNRNIEQLLVQAGFDLSSQQGYVLRPHVLGYHYWGEARVAG